MTDYSRTTLPSSHTTSCPFNNVSSFFLHSLFVTSTIKLLFFLPHLFCLPHLSIVITSSPGHGPGHPPRSTSPSPVAHAMQRQRSPNGGTYPHPLNIPSQHTLSTHVSTHLKKNTLLTHPLNPPYQRTVSTSIRYSGRDITHSSSERKRGGRIYAICPCTRPLG